MNFLSLRAITLAVLVLGGLWVLFLFSAQLLLDFEQSKHFFTFTGAKSFDQQLPISESLAGEYEYSL